MQPTRTPHQQRMDRASRQWRIELAVIVGGVLVLTVLLARYVSWPLFVWLVRKAMEP